jgi:hypothetical protein
MIHILQANGSEWGDLAAMAFAALGDQPARVEIIWHHQPDEALTISGRNCDQQSGTSCCRGRSIRSLAANTPRWLLDKKFGSALITNDGVKFRRLGFMDYSDNDGLMVHSGLLSVVLHD